ncbi:chromosome partitioning ATPase [Alteromonas sp. KC3]|uniref:XrtA-associated tyrosine autokinase n=1 Tax=unclassified Alteromonas TaxID=2614992 RepID=UPI001922ACD0|nr:MULTISPECIES: XrtA-associated tyrosine autokinase [unclassified Alteromonas]BCO19946.1 chromosome partitioning ATPase [Alteromonas sp. KC3]BCO23911.1 chromosome partitioning ATPase [Alteromonas sp. KC14]
MKNTIEKALQKQREAKANSKKASTDDLNHESPQVDAQVNAPTEHSADSVQANTPVTGETPAQTVTQEAELPKGEAQQSPASSNQPQRSPLPEFVIDFERLEKNGHISLTGERKQINEEYREIKRKLLANSFGSLSKTLHNPNIIMVTSSRPSEGKTFTATNLAMSIASEKDKTVLLVDADVLKPNVLNTLGLERRKGLMEYLTGDVEDIADVLYPTNIDKLKIIPAGKSHHLSTELLASQKMHDTVDEFANRYPDRIVIFDTPPLIGINESAILANFAGQAVVVVEEGRAKINDIKMSVERLNPDMAIGFVVNKSIHNDTDGSGYYGYYYSERSN